MALLHEYSTLAGDPAEHEQHVSCPDCGERMYESELSFHQSEECHHDEEALDAAAE